MNIGDVFFSLRGDGSALQVDAKKAAEAAASGADKSFKSKLGNLGKGAVIGAGIAGFNLLTDAVGMAVGKLGEAKAAYEEDQASQVLLAQAMKNNIPSWDGNTAAVEKYAGSLVRLGFTDDEVRAALGQTIGVTHDLTESENLNAIAVDLARAKNLDLATATDIVTKAHEGNGKALKALGIEIGGAKTGAELLDAIQKNVAGSAEAWAQTNSGKLAVSNAKVSEAMEKIGAIVSRVAEVVIPLLSDAFVWLADTLGQVWDAAQPVITTIAGVLQPAFETLGKVIGPIWDGITSAIKTAADIIMAVLQPIIDAMRWVIDNASNILFTKEGQPAAGIGGPVGTTTPTKKPTWVNPNTPGFAAGGIVPGLVGAPMLAVVHGGEIITPSGDGSPVVIRVEAGGNRLIDYIDENLAYRRR